MSRFELKHISFFLFISVLCVNAIENRDTCRIFFSETPGSLTCKKHGGMHRPPHLENSVIMYKCDNGDYWDKGVDTDLHFQSFYNGLCSLIPGNFLFLESHAEIEKFYSRSKTSILQNNSFYGLCKLKIIELDGCGIEIIESKAFACVQSIYRLSLGYNKIEALPRDIFKEMRGLKYLVLDWNRILTFSPGTFDNLVFLEWLSLGYNLIFYLPDDIFPQTALLEDLRLHDNKLVNLSSRVLSNLLQLKQLTLNNNVLKSLSNSFSNNRNLARMSISQNFDLNLTANSFVGLENLWHLHIAQCNLKFLPRDLFLETPKLRYLNLTENSLSLITDEIFESLTHLQVLALGSNNIIKLRKPFQNNKNLSYIDLSKNEISVIGKDLFQGLSLLRALDLSENNIEIFAEGSFNGLSSLIYLLFAHNLVTSLHGDSSNNSILSDLTDLQYLIATNNRIKYLKNALVNNKRIQFLYMSENPLILENDSFRELIELKLLRLENCNMTSLPKHLFRDTSQLTHVFLNRNNFKEITTYTFRNLPNLMELHISFSNIPTLKGRLFNKLAKLESLMLNSNNLSEIKRTDFEGLFSLKYLDLSRNFITKIENNSFTDVQNLVTLELNYNLLTSFSGFNPFLNYYKLRDIDVSYNRLTDIWSMNLSHFKNLEILKASNNRITEFFIPEIFPVQVVLEIHLEWNKIRHVYIYPKQIGIRMNVYDSMKYPIYFSGNPLQCDCHMYHLYEHLNGSNFLPHVQFQDDLICKSPTENNGTKLNKLKPIDFKCSITDHCPDKCVCTFRAHDNTQLVNCSNQNYSNLPIEAPFNTSILYIRKNNLTSLLRLGDSLWENLTEIYADDNMIESEAFVIPKKLKYLSLQNNKLKRLPSTVEKHTEKVTDFKIAISNNLWSCDCSLIVFKNWLLQHLKQVNDINEVRCVFPNNSLSIASFVRVEDSDLCPLMYVFGYLIGVIIVLLFTSCLVFYNKYKLYILAFIYTHCNCLYATFCCDRPSEEDKTFDCFISYSSDDRDVTLAILEELEAKPPHYKFCIHERNWMPGRYITNNIIVSVQNSRKTLIILSDTFLKSKWFLLEFEAAYQQTLRDKKNRLIMVLKDDLPDRSELSDDVAFVISWKTYLLWGEKWFWEKLRKAIFEDSSRKIEQTKCTLGCLSGCFSGKSDNSEQNIPMSQDSSCETRV